MLALHSADHSLVHATTSKRDTGCGDVPTGAHLIDKAVLVRVVPAVRWIAGRARQRMAVVALLWGPAHLDDRRCRHHTSPPPLSYSNSIVMNRSRLSVAVAVRPSSIGYRRVLPDGELRRAVGGVLEPQPAARAYDIGDLVRLAGQAVRQDGHAARVLQSGPGGDVDLPVPHTTRNVFDANPAGLDGSFTALVHREQSWCSF